MSGLGEGDHDVAFASKGLVTVRLQTRSQQEHVHPSHCQMSRISSSHHRESDDCQRGQPMVAITLEVSVQSQLV